MTPAIAICCHLRSSARAVIVAALFVSMTAAADTASQTAVTERTGFRCISSKPFPAAENSQFISKMSADFVPLARNPSNQQHLIELEAAGDGDVSIDSFYIYQPPEPQPPAPSAWPMRR